MCHSRMRTESMRVDIVLLPLPSQLLATADAERVKEEKNAW